MVVSERWVPDASSPQVRGGLLSVARVASLGATALGQLLLNAAPIDGMELFVLVSVLVSLSLVPIALTTSRSMPALQPTARMKIRALFKRSPMGAVGCFATGLINGAFWGMGAVYAHTAGLDPRTISVFMAIVVLGGIMSQWPLGRLSDRIDRRVVLAGLAAAIAVASFGIARFGGVSHDLMFGLGWLFGAAAFPLYAISIAHVNDTLSSEDFVPASSALLLLYAMGAVFGPFVGGAAIEAFGAPGLFYYNAAVSCALFAFTLNRLYFGQDRKSTRLNSSHRCISYAVFCLKKKKNKNNNKKKKKKETYTHN